MWSASLSVCVSPDQLGVSLCPEGPGMSLGPSARLPRWRDRWGRGLHRPQEDGRCPPHRRWTDLVFCPDWTWWRKTSGPLQWRGAGGPDNTKDKLFTNNRLLLTELEVPLHLEI